MAPGDFNTIFGRQRAVWAQEGQVLVGGMAEHFEAVIIEAGAAAREGFGMKDDYEQQSKLPIPIMVVPPGATVVKTVAMAAPATFYWDDHADSAIWGVDEVHVEEDTTTRQLFLVATIAQGGERTALLRIAYHITIFIQGRKYIADPTQLQELENA
jgi:hypothetical protein